MNELTNLTKENILNIHILSDPEYCNEKKREINNY